MTGNRLVNLPPECSPAPAERLLVDLAATPEGGRDALVVARLHELKDNRSDRAAELLRVLTVSELPGVRSSTVAVLADMLDPSAILRCLERLPASRTFQVRHVCQGLEWRAALGLISNVRDGRMSLGPFVGFDDEVLTLGFLLASANHLPYEQDTASLHRKDGAETVFLLGAARSPGEFIRELRRVKILSWPRHNYDYELVRWALANPALAGGARSHVITQNAPQVVSRLRSDGLLTMGETVSWLQAGSPDDVRTRTLSVLSLPEDVTGATELKRVAVRLCSDLAAVTAHLTEEARAALSRSLSLDPETREIVEGLLEEWRSGAGDLLATARSLRSNGPTNPF